MFSLTAVCRACNRSPKKLFRFAGQRSRTSELQAVVKHRHERRPSHPATIDNILTNAQCVLNTKNTFSALSNLLTTNMTFNISPLHDLYSLEVLISMEGADC